MQQHPFKTILLALLLAASGTTSAQTPADETIFDSAAAIACTDGRLSLVGGDGNLFLYAEYSGGFRSVYYLFTPRPYIHFDATTSTAAPDDYIAITGHNGKWVNIATHAGANGDPAFRIADPAPYRCVKTSNGEAQIILPVDHNKQKTDRTMQLTVLPRLEKPSIACHIMHDGDSIALDDFRNIKFDPASEHPMAGYTLAVERSNSILIDSIGLADGRGVKYNDTPLAAKQIEIPLDDIVPNHNTKKVELAIHHRIFDKSNSLKTDTHSVSFRISWAGRTAAGGWLKAVTILIILLLAALTTWTALPVLIHNKNAKSISATILKSNQKTKKQ